MKYTMNDFRFLGVLLLAVALSFLFSCASTMPPELLEMRKRVFSDSAEPWTDGELEKFVDDVRHLAERYEDENDVVIAEATVLYACDRFGSYELAKRLRRDAIGRLKPLLRNDPDRWTSLMIGLGQVWREGADGESEYEEKLALIDELTSASGSALVQGIAAQRRVRLLWNKDRLLGGIPDTEVASALALVDDLEARAADLDDYWTDGALELANSVRMGLTTTRDGLLAPEIVGEDIDGKSVALSDYRGRVVVVEFWASW